MRLRALLAGLLLGASALATTIPGAIRWDPWYGSVNGIEVQRTLGPPAWHTRAPFFSVVNSPFDITINGNTQATIDAEITYAHNAGLQYWAYLWYMADSTNNLSVTPVNAMMNAWALHQSSSIANQMNWAAMISFQTMYSTTGCGGTCGQKWFTDNTPTLIGWFKQSNYQTVLSGRPLLFIADPADSASLTYWWNHNWTNVASAITTFRAAVVAAGLPTPYIVVMAGASGGTITQWGADATTNYIPSHGPPAQPQSWATAEASIEAYWSSLSSAASAVSADMVPIASEGWDTRPRDQNAMTFNVIHPHFNQSTYITLPTPSQLTTELQDCVNFVNANPSTNHSKLILIYAWSECDEGGNCLMPHWSASGPDTTTLNAVGAVSW